MSIPRARPGRKVLELKEHDRVVTAFANSAAGPGWANSPLWVVIRDGMTGLYREECIQPEEQTDEMHALYPFSQLAHVKMMAAVVRSARRKGVSKP